MFAFLRAMWPFGRKALPAPQVAPPAAPLPLVDPVVSRIAELQARVDATRMRRGSEPTRDLFENVQAAPKSAKASVENPLLGLLGEVAADNRPVRTRFAPSPTGPLHIGGARTALMSYLFAKRMGGEFVLRIEDTDLARSRAPHTAGILASLRALGITWDADVIHQSRRTELYADKVNRLIAANAAYRDSAGAVWFRMPNDGDVIVRDRVKGPVRFAYGGKALGDFVIQRPDGSATFLLANVIDDGEQGITHVIRGDDHLNNTAKQIPLFNALGYPVPQFAHLPLILDDDGAKLSKRKGATGVLDFLEEGFDAEILVNHLARLGLAIRSDAMLPLDELARAVDPWGFRRAPARIDLPKLRARNRDLLGRLEGSELAQRVAELDPSLAERLGPRGLNELVVASRGRASTLGDIIALAEPLLETPDPAQVTAAVPEPDAQGVASLISALEALPAESWSAATLDGLLKDALGPTNTTAFRALRAKLTGADHGLAVAAVLAVLGRDEALPRLRNQTTTGSQRYRETLFRTLGEELGAALVDGRLPALGRAQQGLASERVVVLEL